MLRRSVRMVHDVPEVWAEPVGPLFGGMAHVHQISDYPDLFLLSALVVPMVYRLFFLSEMANFVVVHHSLLLSRVH